MIYPNVLDTFHIERQGYLKLSCLPGTLRYQDETYDVMRYPESGATRINPEVFGDLPSFPPQVSRPSNLLKGFSLSWKISVQDDRELHAGLLLCLKASNSRMVELDPLNLLLALKHTLLVESCPHDRRVELQPADQFAWYAYPWQDHRDAEDATSIIDVVPVDGADDLRCFALACTETRLVLRRNACLSCCLNLCRDTDVHVLIL